jgi:hypothetical protein
LTNAGWSTQLRDDPAVAPLEDNFAFANARRLEIETRRHHQDVSDRHSLGTREHE